jgi:hypothetical protein
MTPKEKAIELVNKYLRIYDGRVIQGKQCALIAVDVIIFELKIRNCNVKYFEEVKQEIEKL